MSNQIEDKITYMDADLYKAIDAGDNDILKDKYSEAPFHLQRTPKRNTILHLAAQFGHLECVSFILDLPSSSSLLLEPNLKGEIPLHLAAREGHLEVVKALIAAVKSLHHGMESGVAAYMDMLRMITKDGDTALHEAVRYHHSEVVKSLIEEDPDFIYGANIKGYTPLYMAAERGYGDLVDIIIDNTRTSPAHTGIMGRTALHAAVIRKDKEMIAKLLERKADLTKEVDENAWSPLHCAASLGYASIVKQLLEKSSDKSVTYLGIKDGNRTALHLAARRGNRETVKVLLSHCPDCSEQVDDKGNNVLHFAMMSKTMHVASRLLNKSSPLRVRGLVNEQDAQGDTPLHLLASCEGQDPPFFEDDRVDKMALNNHNLTALDTLSRSNVPIYREYAKKLREDRKLFGPLTWQETVKSNEDSETNEEKDISELKRVGENHLIVAALIATVTFAAGFTLPGGYKGDNGMATLSKKAAFKAFVVTDTIAVMLSVSAVFVYFFMQLHDKRDFVSKHLIYGFCLNLGGMGAMVVAFMTGLYAVLPLSSGLPIVTCIICCCFLFAFYFGFRQVYKS